ncbi:hypothetical protein [Kribbella sp. NPDC055071]
MTRAEYLSGVAVLVSVLSAILAWRIGSRTVRNMSYRSATDLMLEVDRIFIEHPSLRKYFYDQMDCPKGHKDRALVEAVAELTLDVLECIWDDRRNYSRRDLKSWDMYIGAMFEQSPAVVEAYDPTWYPTLASWFRGPRWWSIYRWRGGVQTAQ